MNGGNCCDQIVFLKIAIDKKTQQSNEYFQLRFLIIVFYGELGAI
jgi:hypothetical protein